MKDKSKESVIDRAISIFLVTSPSEFLKDYSLQEFKNIINLLPRTHLYQTMCISLMDDFILSERYEHCQILHNFLQLTTQPI